MTSSSSQKTAEAGSFLREKEQADVIKRIEEDIIFGRFAPGSRLIEDTLMTRYCASRHSVRQGLFQLERNGIVLREKNVGATVRFYSSDEVRQIYEVREMLTRQAVLIISLPASDTLIGELTTLQERYCSYADRGDLRGIHDANDAFHLALFSACGNPYLVESLQNYMNLTSEGPLWACSAAKAGPAASANSAGAVPHSDRREYRNYCIQYWLLCNLKKG